MRRTARLSLAVAALSAFGLSLPASAAVGPSAVVMTDPAGDSKAAPFSAVTGTGDDITKVTWTTKGVTTTKKVRKKVVTTYTPKALVIALQVSTAIDTSGKVNYNVEGTADCGPFNLSISPGAALGDLLISSCGSSNDPTVDLSISGAEFAVAGNTLTFTVPLGAADGFAAGKTLSSLFAYTGSVDPVTGTIGPVGVIGSSPVDNDDASTDASYKIG